MENPFLRRLEQHAALGPQTTAAVTAATATPRHFRAKQDLVREGDRPSAAFVVLAGWLCRYTILPGGYRRNVALLMPGDVCLFRNNPAKVIDHSVQTITTADVVVLSPGHLTELSDRHPTFAAALSALQRDEETAARALIVSMGRRSSIERVSHFLLELFLRAELAGLMDGGRATLPLPQKVLGDTLCITPVHSNRVLKELRSAGAVEVSRGHCVVESPSTLARMAGYDDKYLNRRREMVGAGSRSASISFRT